MRSLYASFHFVIYSHFTDLFLLYYRIFQAPNYRLPTSDQCCSLFTGLFYYSSLQTPLICERLQVEAGLIARPPTEVRSDIRGGEVNQLCALKASGPHRHAACFKQTNGFL